MAASTPSAAQAREREGVHLVKTFASTLVQILAVVRGVRARHHGRSDPCPPEPEEFQNASSGRAETRASHLFQFALRFTVRACAYQIGLGLRT